MLIRLAWKLARLRSRKIRKMRSNARTLEKDLAFQGSVVGELTGQIAKVQANLADLRETEAALRQTIESQSHEINLRNAEIEILKKQVEMLVDINNRDAQRVQAEIAMLIRIQEGVDSKAQSPTLTALSKITPDV